MTGGPAVPQPVQLVVDAGVVLRYAEVAQDFNPIHFDDTAARRLGLPRAIAHGMIAGALLSKMLAAHFGEAWMRTGVLDVKFVRPTLIGDTLTATASPSRTGPGILDVRVDNGLGEPVIVGTAHCRYASTGSAT